MRFTLVFEQFFSGFTGKEASWFVKSNEWG